MGTVEGSDVVEGSDPKSEKGPDGMTTYATGAIREDKSLRPDMSQIYWPFV